MKNAQQSVRVVRYLLPLGLLLGPGIRFTVDGQQATPGKFAVCFPNGCFAEAGNVGADLVNALKKGTTLNISVQNQAQREVTFAVPLAGFGKAFDGPAVDPKVLEEQQKKLQAELEKRSEDMAFFIGIAGPWLVLAVLDLLAIRRDRELSRIP